MKDETLSPLDPAAIAARLDELNAGYAAKDIPALLARVAELEAEVARLRDAERIAWALIGADHFNPRRMPFLIRSCKLSWPPYTEFPTNRMWLYCHDRALVLPECPPGEIILTDEARAAIDAAREIAAAARAKETP